MSEIDAQTMKQGQEGYMLCQACHGADGNGVANLAPPLAGSEWVLGPAENLVRMQFRGLQGPITVKGQEYNLVMAPMGPALGTDEKIASVLTYIRNSWGNEASVVTAADVAPHRGEIGKPMLTVAELIDPNEKAGGASTPPADTKAPKGGEAKPAPVKKTQEKIVIEPSSSGNSSQGQEASTSTLLGGIGFGFWVIICLIPVLGGLVRSKK